MAASYKKLFKLLIDRDMKKKELAEKAGISIATITKMGKDGGQKCKKEPHAEFPPEKRYRFRFPGVVPNRSL